MSDLGAFGLGVYIAPQKCTTMDAAKASTIGTTVIDTFVLSPFFSAHSSHCFFRRFTSVVGCWHVEQRIRSAHDGHLGGADDIAAVSSHISHFQHCAQSPSRESPARSSTAPQSEQDGSGSLSLYGIVRFSGSSRRQKKQDRCQMCSMPAKQNRGIGRGGAILGASRREGWRFQPKRWLGLIRLGCLLFWVFNF